MSNNFFHSIVKIKDKIANTLDTLQVVGVLTTIILIVLVSVFHVKVSTRLKKIPFIENIISVNVIEGFEDVDKSDVFYTELERQIPELSSQTGDVTKIQVRKDKDGQKTFKVLYKDGTEKFFTAKQSEDKTFQTQKSDIDTKGTRGGGNTTILGDTTNTVSTNSNGTGISNTTNSRAMDLQSSCQIIAQDAEKKGLTEGKTIGYKEGYSEAKDIGYKAGYTDGKKDGYSAGYTAGKKTCFGYGATQ